jgi:hypothetical protein
MGNSRHDDVLPTMGRRNRNLQGEPYPSGSPGIASARNGCKQPCKGAESIPLGGNCMAKRSHNEVQESLRELTRIFRPKDPRKFVKDYIRKYRITGGYEDELTMLVEREMVKLNSPAS